MESSEIPVINMNGEDGWIKWIKLMMQKAREAREIIEEIDEDIFDHLNIANDVLFIIKDFVNGEVSSRDLTNRLGGIAGECLGGYIGGKLLGKGLGRLIGRLCGQYIGYRLTGIIYDTIDWSFFEQPQDQAINQAYSHLNVTKEMPIEVAVTTFLNNAKQAFRRNCRQELRMLNTVMVTIAIHAGLYNE